jgi:hypothetical protein
MQMCGYDLISPYSQRPYPPIYIGMGYVKLATCLLWTDSEARQQFILQPRPVRCSFAPTLHYPANFAHTQTSLHNMHTV